MDRTQPGSEQHWRHWRHRIFAITWIAYAGFYLCRKNFSVLMPTLDRELHYSKDDLAWAITGFSLIYMLGQFVNGFLSDRFGPRAVVGAGLVIAAASNLAMGFYADILLLFGLFNLLNGLGQSTGWSGTVKNMSTWFSRRERGVVMAWWGTCYALGGVIATSFATFVAFRLSWFSELGWRRGLYFPAVLLALIAVLYIWLTRNRPSDVGLPDHVDELPGASAAQPDGSPVTPVPAWRQVLSSPAVWVTGAMYFLLKMVRYAFLFWLPMYLVEGLAYGEESAGYTSAIYELAGFGGVVLAGYASDKLMGSRRFPVACLMLLGLSAALFLYPVMGHMGSAMNIAGICLIGILTFGPDALMSGAAAMDLGSQEAAGMASGVINGLGSAGQAVSPLIVAALSQGALGWNGLFTLFALASLAAAGLMALKWNDG